MAGFALTARQWQILALIHDGLSNKGIAHSLGISEGTVKAHVTALLRRLGVNSRVEAAFLLPCPSPEDTGSQACAPQPTRLPTPPRPVPIV